MLLKDELKTIISGTGFVTKGTAIQAVANDIRKSKATGLDAEKKEPVKEQEAAAILGYALVIGSLSPTVRLKKIKKIKGSQVVRIGVIKLQQTIGPPTGGP